MVAPEDRVGLRTKITQRLGGTDVRKFVERIGLTHAVRLRVGMKEQRPNNKDRVRLFGISQLDTFDQLRLKICEVFGQCISGFVAQGSTAYISNITISFTPIDGPLAGYRQFIGDPVISNPALNAGRQYENRIAHLKAEMMHDTSGCCCGECDENGDVPQVYVQIGLVGPETVQDVHLTRKERTIAKRKTKKNLKKLTSESVLRLEDLARANGEKDGYNTLHDHGGPSQARVTIDVDVLSSILRERLQLRVGIDSLKDQLGRHRHNTVKRRHKAIVHSSSSSLEHMPLAKKQRTRRKSSKTSETTNTEGRRAPALAPIEGMSENTTTYKSVSKHVHNTSADQDTVVDTTITVATYPSTSESKISDTDVYIQTSDDDDSESDNNDDEEPVKQEATDYDFRGISRENRRAIEQALNEQNPRSRRVTRQAAGAATAAAHAKKR